MEHSGSFGGNTPSADKSQTSLPFRSAAPAFNSKHPGPLPQPRFGDKLVMGRSGDFDEEDFVMVYPQENKGVALHTMHTEDEGSSTAHDVIAKPSNRISQLKGEETGIITPFHRNTCKKSCGPLLLEWTDNRDDMTSSSEFPGLKAASSVEKDEIKCEPKAFADNPNAQGSTFKPIMCFFYGTMMDTKTMQSVLGLSDEPNMIPATITGFKRMRWHEMAVLLPSKKDSVVRGVALEIQTKDQYERLDHYEGSHWRPTECQIRLDNGYQVAGTCFKWGLADKSELIPGPVFEDFEAEKTRLICLARGWSVEGARQMGLTVKVANKKKKLAATDEHLAKSMGEMSTKKR